VFPLYISKLCVYAYANPSASRATIVVVVVVVVVVVRSYQEPLIESTATDYLCLIDERKVHNTTVGISEWGYIYSIVRSRPTGRAVALHIIAHRCIAYSIAYNIA
jgi:hypothetical protein